MAVDPGHGGFAAASQRLKQVRKSTAFLMVGEWLVDESATEITSGGKGQVARSSDHDDPHRSIDGGAPHQAGELRHGSVGERVAPFRVVDGDGDPWRVDVVAQHGFLEVGGLRIPLERPQIGSPQDQLSSQSRPDN